MQTWKREETKKTSLCLRSKCDTPKTLTQQQDSRKLEAVRAFGPNPTEWNSLAQCRGDCDIDSHCRGRLICFQRGRFQPVHGCEGGRDDRTPSDYCIDPNDMTEPLTMNFLRVNPPRKNLPLQECEGDCDPDSE
ncbi:hypothetical protein IV203_008978 [Nitzschia inconspicua]|uniref:Uncharacterized protein n=1 Tax=Nitzschia inconspicua TaxID=303405 RepID=A0A9K3K5Q8_9STRA|nr:hypothetical protein IV203_011244 [Nitzschia inconspicua]KAG7352930.1 hypothetical protein IV203_008978 [Nitzschia inconspicua]